MFGIEIHLSGTENVYHIQDCLDWYLVSQSRHLTVH